MPERRAIDQISNWAGAENTEVTRMFRRLCRSFVSICLISSCLTGNVLAEEGAAEKPEFSFGVVTDVHYSEEEPSGRMHCRASLKKLEESVGEFNSKNLAFVIQLGDLINRDFESFDRVLSVYQGLKAGGYHVLGNHETWVAEEKIPAVSEKLGMKGEYYDFEVHGWRFIVLNSNDMGTSARPGSPEYEELEAIYEKLKKTGLPADREWGKGLGEKQTAWLKRTLNRAAEAGEKVIIFCHVPVFPSLVRIIESYECVVAYMNGHRHKGHYAEIDGVHYLNLRAMVETDETAYAIVEVYRDRLNVVGYGREPSRVLSIKRAPPTRDEEQSPQSVESPEPVPAETR